MVMRTLNGEVEIAGEKLTIAEAVKRGLLVPYHAKSFSENREAPYREAFFADLPGQSAGHEISREDFLAIGGQLKP